MRSSSPHENAPSSSFTPHENVGAPSSSYTPHDDWNPYYSSLCSVPCSVSTVYREYDVFINNRGPDVKETFATDLYHRLVPCGFRVFLDKYEMHAGLDVIHQIKDAIKTASIHIAILSPRYAESCWCLDELLQMWKKTCESDRDILIPVFYEVKPLEVRHRTGRYGEALRSHETKHRFNPFWEDALSVAANKMGFELGACNGGYEKLLNEVVGRVLEIGKKTASKYVTAEEFLATAHGFKTMVVGIVGPGAVGKTTLAKNFYRRKRIEYSRSCFLPDIKESSGISLKGTLVRKLTEGNDSRLDALIVLDDADDAVQLKDGVLSIIDMLGPDSLILVTSRHKHVLRGAEIPETSIYNLTGHSTPTPKPNTKVRLGCHTLKNLPSSVLDPFTSLEELWLHDSPNLKCLSRPYGLLNRLTELNIVDCGIESLEGVMNNLEIFRVYNCPLGELSFRKVPEKLILSREAKLLGVTSQSSPQKVCPNLQHLSINCCGNLSKVGPLPTTLITLDLRYCHKLRVIKELDFLARLRKVDISGCKEVEELPSLHRLTCLESLKASRCSNLKSIQGLHMTTKLQRLYVCDCQKIQLPDVEYCESLEELDACNCGNLLRDDGVLEKLRQRLGVGLKTEKADHWIREFA